MKNKIYSRKVSFLSKSIFYIDIVLCKFSKTVLLLRVTNFVTM